MHGIILSDVFSIPRACFYDKNPPNKSWFKYEDYSNSINIDFSPVKITNFNQINEKIFVKNVISEEILSNILNVAPFEVIDQYKY